VRLSNFESSLRLHSELGDLASLGPKLALDTIEAVIDALEAAIDLVVEVV
jgi:hypothetical protein